MTGLDPVIHDKPQTPNPKINQHFSKAAKQPRARHAMQKKQAPERFSASNLANQRAQGKSRTNLANVKAKSETELESYIASDPDFNNEPPNWHTKAEAIMPPPKTSLSNPPR